MKIPSLAVLKSGKNLQPFEYESEIGPNDVLISLKYCSMTRGDVRFMANYWGDTKFPLVPGSEMFGVIEQIGNEVKDFEIGDYVGAGYQISSCHECEYCLAGKEQFCHSQKVLCIGGFGGVAKQIIFDNSFIFKIPTKLQNPNSVSLMCSGLTVYSAIKKVNPQPGMKVGVVGVGNLGHFAVKILVALGCEVIAFTHSAGKSDELTNMGVVKIVDSTSEKELADCKNQYDFLISTSSKSLNWRLFIAALKPQGNLMFVGLPEKEVAFPAEMLADYAQKGILGSYIGSPSEMRELLQFAEQNNIFASTKLYKVSEIDQAVTDIQEDRSNFSTVIDLSDWK
ncbi:alcohol dehydrogenase catalytic domain-containing protein [Candidatus Shapirobacteria bacterium]|nr:alcohol dehydrogenase catalytic domain-containing protein [Candidatus Shapirobacteria bacterium]